MQSLELRRLPAERNEPTLTLLSPSSCSEQPLVEMMQKQPRIGEPIMNKLDRRRIWTVKQSAIQTGRINQAGKCLGMLEQMAKATRSIG